MKMGLELEATQSVCWGGGTLLIRSLSLCVTPERSFCVCVLQVIDDKLMFVKVHMPWNVLCTYAEVLHIKLPIQPNDLPSQSSPLRYLSCITKFFYPNQELIRDEAEFFTAPFEKERLELFYIKDRDAFFTPSMRSRMVKSSCAAVLLPGFRNLLYYQG